MARDPKHRRQSDRERKRADQPTQQLPIVTDAQKVLKDPPVKKPGSPVAPPPRYFRDKHSK